LLRERPGSIRMLEDTDGDGVFDKSTLFADKLTFPQGALWVYDSLYVMSPPSLWRFADEDGDGHAEVQEELATGFDFTGNAADVHGPFLHPNGRLYWAHGRKGFAVPDNDTGEIVATGKSARIWSSQLSGGEVEAFAGGGMDNPVEIDFTDEGEIIGTVNLFYGRPRGDTLTHWVHGGAYPRFDQGLVLEEFQKTGELLGAVHNFGHVAVSGMARYRSGALSKDWTDGWLVTHFNTGEITLTKTQQKGASYESTETRTVFKALKPDTHLTDLVEDRNGDLLVLDTGGWFRNGCPTSQIAKPDVGGTIYRISRTDAGPYTAPDYPEWGRLTAEEVADRLGAEEDWLRDRAITELAVRGAPALPELKRILTSETSSAIARTNAIWTLSRMKFSESADLIYDALTDPDATVRHAACNAISVTRSWQIIAENQPAEREIELERNRTISGALAGIVRSDEAPVARAATAALGRMGERRAIGALTGRLGRAGEDRFLEHSLIYALIEMDDFERTREGLESTDPKILSGTLRALDEMPSSKLEVISVLPFLEAEDADLRATALAVAGRHHEWDAAFANAFFNWPEELGAVRKGILETLVPRFADAPPMLDYLTNLVTSDSPARVRLGLELIALSPGIPFQKEWVPAFERALATPSVSDTGPKTDAKADAKPKPDNDLLAIAVAALEASETDRFTAALEAIAGDEALDTALRFGAAKALLVPKRPVAPAAFALCEATLQPGGESAFRAQAVALLVGATLGAAERDRLAPLLAQFGPVEWSSFPNLFRKIDSAEQAAIVIEALVASPAAASLEAATLRARFAAYPDALAKLESKLAEVEAEKAQRSDKIEALVAAMDSANAEEGAKVFAAGKGACLVCHRIGDLGGRIGPDLSTIGRIREARDLYESILYPSESIARDFDTFEVSVKTKDAPVRVGLIDAQTTAGIELIALSGEKQIIPHEEIRSIKPLRLSLMPMGLDQTLTPEDLRDLVAYLMQLR
ncbi:MAG: c-type cytochrome, partial [Verrucomicrobiaceae bacterium]|nr:c-type cytochrome [Verrucomicrobiaceae bacterium]